MKFFWGPGYIQDGKLDDSCGRIVIYDDQLIVGYNRTMDHNYLLRSLAARYKFPVNDVINNAIRLYFKFDNGQIILSGVRDYDNRAFENRKSYYGRMIKKEMR